MSDPATLSRMRPEPNVPMPAAASATLGGHSMAVSISNDEVFSLRRTKQGAKNARETIEPDG